MTPTRCLEDASWDQGGCAPVHRVVVDADGHARLVPVSLREYLRARGGRVEVVE